MQRNILCSIRLWWAYQIYLGNKKLEMRKTKPQYPANVYLYISKNSYNDLEKIPEKDREMCKQWIAHIPLKFTLNEVEELTQDYSEWLPKQIYDVTEKQLKDMCLTQSELWNYGRGKSLYAWHIDDLQIYDTPKELSEFYRLCDYKNSFSILRLTRPPQSWCRCEELEEV